MKWLYCAVKYRATFKKGLMMDSVHHLDDVWHAYILHTKEYFEMSKELFDIEYIHHHPENPFKKESTDNDLLREQLIFIHNEWGDDYIDRVWQYGADISDIAND